MTIATLEALARLVGRWQGNGAGRYPTIDSFEYEELLSYELDRSYPMLHYEQRTFLLPDREPSHWESGFIRPQEDGTIEISSAQDSGRVEVLRGRLGQLNATDRWELALDSVALAHDPRLVETRRVFTLDGDRLSYVKFMATNTTQTPQLQQHLEARLQRVVER